MSVINITQNTYQQEVLNNGADTAAESPLRSTKSQKSMLTHSLLQK